MPDEINIGRKGDVERLITHARSEATNAVRELDAIASNTNSERLFAFLFLHIAIIGARGDRTERAKAPVKLEFAFFHLSPHFGKEKSRQLNAELIQRALDAVDTLYEAQGFGASGFFDAQRPIDEASFVRMSLYFEATLARGSAYPVQLRNQILGVQAKFDASFEARAKIRPSRAVSLIDAALEALRTNSGRLGRLAFDYGEAHKDAFHATNQEATLEQAFAIIMSGKLAESALDVLPVAPAQLKLEPPPSDEEWSALINLVGCTPPARSAMSDAWKMYRRPLFVFPDNRILPWALPHIYEQLWAAFEETISQEDAFRDGEYAEQKKHWSEGEVVVYLKRLFPAAAVYQTLDYPDPDKQNGTAELDLAVHWPPFLIFVEVKFRRFRFESHLRPGGVGVDIKESVGEGFEQARRAARYLHLVEEARFTERDTKRVLTVSRKQVRRLYFTTVTKYLPMSLTAGLSQMGWLFKDGEYPWALSLDDLDNLSRFCPGPDAFLHYIERRLAIQREGKKFIGTELDFFGYYLKTRLHPSELPVAKNAGRVLVSTHGEQEPFDEVMEKEVLGEKVEWRPDFQLPEEVVAVLRELRKRNNDESARWITFSLLSFSRNGVATVGDLFQKIRQMPLTPGKLRRMVATVDDIVISVTATDDLSQEDLGQRTVLRATIEKYRHQKRKSISFGVRVPDTTMPFEHAVWLEGEWKHDPEAEKLFAIEPETWPMPKTALPGRNDKCFCGSGKKFKKCCWPRIQGPQ